MSEAVLCTKYTNYSVHNVITLVGFLGLVTSAWVQLSDFPTAYRFLSTLKTDMLMFKLCLYAISFGLIILGLLGYVSFNTENKALRITYFILGFVMMVVSLVSGIAVVLSHPEVKGYDKPQPKNTNYTNALSLIQEQLHCCGIKSHTDYGAAIPPSCCKVVDGQRQKCANPKDVKKLYDVGCKVRHVEYWKEKCHRFVGPGLLLTSCLILLGAILTRLLMFVETTCEFE